MIQRIVQQQNDNFLLQKSLNLVYYFPLKCWNRLCVVTSLWPINIFRLKVFWQVKKANQWLFLKTMTVPNSSKSILPLIIFMFVLKEGSLIRGVFDIRVEPLVQLWRVGAICDGAINIERNHVDQWFKLLTYLQLKLGPTFASHSLVHLGGLTACIADSVCEAVICKKIK